MDALTDAISNHQKLNVLTSLAIIQQKQSPYITLNMLPKIYRYIRTPLLFSIAHRKTP